MIKSVKVIPRRLLKKKRSLLISIFMKDMDFDLTPGSRIVVAMSGGVDSSVTAALLMEAGYEVVGLTMRLYDNGEIMGKKGSCCAGQDIYDARQVADKLGFPHYILDYESLFKESVIDKFADTYVAGYTPIPCIQCNQTVKFRDMLKMAKDLGASALATGHYVQRHRGKHKIELHKGHDPKKDQSYFLFATTQEQLDYLRFPLGGLDKSQTRDLAKRYGLKTADKPDSQGICFVPDGDYASLISKLRPGTLDSGDIIHVDGTILGRHNGIIQYTVGQRKGLGIAHPEPLYVIKINPETKQVIVGPQSALARQTIRIASLNWLYEEIPTHAPLEVSVKIRSTRPPVHGLVHAFSSDNTASITLMTPEFGVAPGQACVLYKSSRVIGGGWIQSSETEDFLHKIE